MNYSSIPISNGMGARAGDAQNTPERQQIWRVTLEGEQWEEDAGSKRLHMNNSNNKKKL